MVHFIPQEKIAEIQFAADIVQIISEYIQLKQSGKAFIGLCPFHSEKTPSFFVNPDKKLFKCFGCGEGGTVFQFVMKQEGMDFVEAVKLVASKSRVDLTQIYAKETSLSSSKKTHLYETTRFAATFYQKMLLDAMKGKKARDYLLKRKINDHSIKNFCIGYAPAEWDSLVKMCKGGNVSMYQLQQAGLIIQKKERDSYYDRFRDRLIFPILDIRKQVVGFGGRALDDSLPKYLNSPETVLFNKSNILYGIDIAKSAILKKQKVILMEGYTDVIMAHQHGIEWAVAVLGTAISKQHLRSLRQYCSRVILLLDADSAGQKSSDRNLDIFIEEEFDVKIAQLPKGYDPCDFLLAEGPEKFLSYIDSAKDFFHFKIEFAATKWDMSTVHGKANALNNVLATAMKTPDAIKRNLLIKLISEEMSIDEAALWSHIKNVKRPLSVPANNNNQKTKQRLDASSMAEREILYLMLSCNSLIPRIINEKIPEEFDNKDFLEIAGRIVEIYQKNKAVKEEDVLHSIGEARLNKLLVDIVTTREFQDMTDYRDRLEACILFFKRRNRRKDIHITKKKMLETARSSHKEEDIVMLLEEYHKKSRNIHALKNKP
ncbi:DNA primase [Candidatus Kuenenia stuttgartiensis]|jgi:DNA primase|uniref:DNA primase n=1 Tax=Kuenenia stuttgartiensis TaxID=174633 RepID=Q1PW47_KUEST|nr:MULTISPECIES: DNA primase [Kuenenia]MBE7545977.1 DNA primase [Planctomycetia bacterium]MCZ7562400.1 DNA primase [Burkholderiales bacterium]MBZ0190402.1 DNA primase [Candidatus Kuenenia stuttgartiensis]MCL4726989.1 DNA primase [Candidatus Kuenenia stuttgartiensis]MCZ7623001.1 DNA primase [Candidatus Kuenenia sp.]